jgi:hypothetical protein
MSAPHTDPVERAPEVCPACQTYYDECPRCGVLLCACDRDDHDDVCTEENPEAFG